MSICNRILQIVQTNLDAILAAREKRTLKPDGSFVTEGDLLCERLVLEFVGSLAENYTAISEEQPLPDGGWEDANVVMIDPVDGTENFTSGLVEWGIGVSVYQSGEHVESMIALPEMGLSLISGDQIQRYASRIHGLSSSLSRPDLARISDGFEYRILGCCMYNMYNVIRGSYALFENFKGANAWDILPGLNLALEHGLAVQIEGENYDGQFLRPDQKYRFRVSNT